MKWRMPIGIDNFKDIRDKHYYFVDKTDFIRQLIDGHSAVTLITRPRRFGKTLVMSMLDWFFSIEKEPESRHLFEQLAVERAGAYYMQQRGQYPVIFLTLKDIKNPSWQSWERMLQYVRLFLSQLYNRYQYLMSCTTLNEGQRRLFTRIAGMEASEDELTLALSNLTEMMQAYYGKKVILLIDEYDVPIQQAWENGYYTGCIGFMRQFLGSALKTNESLDFAVLTGVMRISKESIFSGLNNLEVCTVTSDTYNDIMGFTPQEVAKMAADMDVEEKLPSIRKWYDGYRFGSQEIYNPWSVINFFHTGKVGDYWVNTSDNSILRFLLADTDAQTSRALETLLEGSSVGVSLNEQVLYHNLSHDKGALYALLLTTGYLTAAAVDSTRRNRYTLRIPNQEVTDVYRTEILNHLVSDNGQNTFDDLFDYLLSGNGEAFERQLQTIIIQTVSCYDTANKESFYHGFMLGMTALFLGSSYTIESNRESGYGRFDLAIFPREKDQAGVLMEFKAANKEEALETMADAALKQVEEHQYTAEFAKRRINNVWEYGIAFCGKKICLKCHQHSFR